MNGERIAEVAVGFDRSVRSDHSGPRPVRWDRAAHRDQDRLAALDGRARGDQPAPARRRFVPTDRVGPRPARPRPSRARWRANRGRRHYRAHLAESARRRPCPSTATGQARPQPSPAPNGRASPRGSAGRPSRSPGDCARIIPTSRRCGCPTRRSTSRCSCRAGVPCGAELTRCLRTGPGRSVDRPAGPAVGELSGHGPHQRAPGRGRGPRRARALGGRSHHRQGRTHSAIGTLVERQTRFLMLVALPGGRTAEAVRTPLPTRILTPARASSAGRLTWDRGSEMAEHVRFTVDTGVAGLLLRSPQPLAAWQQREHQRPFPPVLPQGHRPVRPRPGPPRRRRRASSTAALDRRSAG